MDYEEMLRYGTKVKGLYGGISAFSKVQSEKALVYTIIKP